MVELGFFYCPGQRGEVLQPERGRGCVWQEVELLRRPYHPKDKNCVEVRVKLGAGRVGKTWTFGCRGSRMAFAQAPGAFQHLWISLPWL